jgi:hypothetical protein
MIETVEVQLPAPFTTVEVIAGNGSVAAANAVFVQPTAPASPGIPYLWIQTGLPNNGWSLWFSDGE